MKPLKVGIIGLGRIGKIHLDNLLKIPTVEVVTAVNPSEAGQSYAKALGVPNTTSDADELFDNTEIDAVIISSSTDTHAQYAVRGAAAGKAIFCEKPLDLSLETVKGTLEKVNAAGVPLMVAFNQRFDQNFSAIRSAVVSGQIGELHTLHIISRDPGPPPIAYIKTSGGLFKDMTIHDFDMARFIVGSEVAEVFAKGHNLVDPAIGEAGDIDTGIVTLTFENNATAVIENSRKAIYGYDQRLEVFGSKGMMKCENPLKTVNQFYNESGGHTDRNLDFFIDRYEKAYQLEIEAFTSALANNRPMPVTGEDGLQALLIAEAANRSLAESRPVKLKEIQL
ncbi:inositol 2-dehydrogenase [Fulvivirgaceae bacterium BMA10]|uniref:Inositol 2-dehydrogenase n=1 Tax=Splendidivirga corallicola TaxID=3051826 RepID=A0ABT8KXY0_9BACT|nr:inositol 2-dehydrogenase [Fulvivirgaceae bacterium BMA10]